MILITLFAALRGYTGTDTYSYHMMFIDYGNRSYWESIQYLEPLFVLLMKVVSVFTSYSFAYSGLIAIIQGVVLLLIAEGCPRPADFMAIYVSLFYLLFEFNTLRAGLAILFLLLAYQKYDENDQKMFVLLGIMAILSHYSALIGLVPLIFLVEKKSIHRIVALTLLLLAGGGVTFFIIYSGQTEKILLYLALALVGKSTSYGLGFFLNLVIYIVLFTTSVEKKNKVELTTLFILWVLLRTGSNYFSFIDRLEIIVNSILLMSILRSHAVKTRSAWHGLALVGLVFLGLYGGLSQLKQADIQVGFDEQSNYGKSPYVPYHFFWEDSG